MRKKSKKVFIEIVDILKLKKVDDIDNIDNNAIRNIDLIGKNVFFMYESGLINLSGYRSIISKIVKEIVKQYNIRKKTKKEKTKKYKYENK